MCRCAVAVDGGHVVPLVVVDVVQVCVGGCVDLCLHGDGGDGGERLERHHQRGGDGDGGGPIRERLERHHRRAGDGGPILWWAWAMVGLERLERHHRRAGNGDGGERLEHHHQRGGDGDGGAGGPIRERLERLERAGGRAGGAGGPIRERLERLERRAGDGDGGGDGQQVVDLCFWLCAPRKLLLSQPHAHAPYLVGNRSFGQNIAARQGWPDMVVDKQWGPIRAGDGGPIRERLGRLERHHQRGGDGQQVVDLCFSLSAPRKLLYVQACSSPHK